MKAIKTEFAAEWRDNKKWVRGLKYRTIEQAVEHAHIVGARKHRLIKIVTLERESVLVAKK